MSEALLHPRRWGRAFRQWVLLRRLSQRRPGQLQRFLELVQAVPDLYRRVAPTGTGPYAMPTWIEANARLAADLIPSIPFGFLRHPTVRRMMFVDAGGDWLRAERAYLRSREPAGFARSLLLEDPCGLPTLLDEEPPTSHNTVHHAHHLERHAEQTGVRAGSLGRIVEWGGGYGNLAKLVWRSAAGALTYVIIDTPLFCCVQWVYLGTVLGPTAVRCVTDPSEGIESGRVNLLPVAFLPRMDLRADLFVSTWALSECSKAALSEVVDRRWFGARHLLLAAHEASPEFPQGRSLVESAVASGADILPIEFLPGHCYALR